MIRAQITVTLKDDVMDPQGQAVGQALGSLGFGGVESVRVGRHFDLMLEGDDVEAARKNLAEMCDKLLANTVIERYDINLEKC